MFRLLEVLKRKRNLSKLGTLERYFIEELKPNGKTILQMQQRGFRYPKAVAREINKKLDCEYIKFVSKTNKLTLEDK